MSNEEKDIQAENKIISKKEQYDLEKKKRLEEKNKNKNKAKSKSKSRKKKQQGNLGKRIFAIVMLLLMLGSVVASILSYTFR